MVSEPITIVVVDDHPIWRDGVARDLGEHGFEVVATAADVETAVRAVQSCEPNVVLMDLNLGQGSGVEATRRITGGTPESPVLVLSASGEQDDVLEAVKAGATGYLIKSASVEELVEAVRSTAQGNTVFTPGLAGLVLGEFRRMAETPSPDTPALSERETTVLRLVAKGLSARQIATKLSLSHRTVENHVHSTLRKLRLENRVELTRYAIEHGIAEDE